MNKFRYVTGLPITPYNQQSSTTTTNEANIYLHSGENSRKKIMTLLTILSKNIDKILACQYHDSCTSSSKALCKDYINKQCGYSVFNMCNIGYCNLCITIVS